MATIYTYALTSLADVKESLGITNDASNNLITRKINQATDMIEGYCGLDDDHHFKETTYTNEEYDGSGTNQLSLKMRWVSTLSTLQSRNVSTNQDSWTTIDDDNYFLDKKAGIVDALFTFSRHWNRWRVTYTAGFSTIPADLGEAAAQLAAYMFNNEQTAGAGVKRKEEGQREIEYFQPSDASSLFKQLGIDDTLAKYYQPPLIDDK